MVNININEKDFVDGLERYSAYKIKNGAYPKTISLKKQDGKIVSIQERKFEDATQRFFAYILKNNVAPKTVSVDDGSTTPKPPSKIITETPVVALSQNAFNNPSSYNAYCCGPVSSAMVASHYDIVTTSNWKSKVSGLITSQKCKIGSGTSPDNLRIGFNNYFTSLKLTEVTFNEDNIKKHIKDDKPMVCNVLTSSGLGYKGKFGHYIAITGYKDSKVRLNDPNYSNIGKPTSWWCDYSVLRSAVVNNGSRPLWVCSKK